MIEFALTTRLRLAVLGSGNGAELRHEAANRIDELELQDTWRVGIVAEQRTLITELEAELEQLRADPCCPTFYDGCNCPGVVAELEAEIEQQGRQIVDKAMENGKLLARIDQLEAEKEELKDQAADDIIWMSGIGPIPDAGLAAWSGIQERWLQ